MASLFEKLFGTYSDRELKKVTHLVDKIESLDGEMQKLTDEQLKGKTFEFKNRLNNGETLDDILPEAFAVVREAAYRVLGMKHFRVQLLGGIILHQGRIAEMRTGEGKTLVATLPAYLNALTGKGVHIVTVNDYLAKRDKEWMGKIHEFLGLTVGCIIHDISNADRKAAYNCDITYGTNNEFGFDYLRDNMVIYKEDMVQRPLYFAIVDEVDSILVDEARTPLIISGVGDKSTKLYEMADNFVRTLTSRIMDPSEERIDPFNSEFKEETVDYVIDEKARSCSITEKGTAKAEAFFGIENLSDMENMEIAHHINQALKARSIMKRDIDYVVKDGEVIIVDEFTGRLMQGRRYSDGLHQAIEAKEKLNVRSESKTLATITFQNYFRMYTKLSGMTGTAKTEESEFREIYDMDVVEIPTNKPVIRQDLADVIYRNEGAKFRAVVKEIKEKHKTGQPILVGTITIEKSEILSNMLKKEGIPHEVLNAKHHDREAEIVAQAGRFGAVTIATNMAGRGTDIALGGNPEFLAKQEMKKKGYSDEILTLVDSFYDTDNKEVLEARKVYKDLYDKYKVETDEENKKVLEAGGLHIIGTERHESRRIDNQLRGRAGRQGDPGSSRFYISLEDDLMRLFGGERIINLIDNLKMPEDEPLEHSMLTRAIENAQKKVEGNNFGIRKHVLKYDDVMNKQREVIYGERRKVLEGEDLRAHIQEMVKSLVTDNVEMYTQSKYPEEWDLESIENYVMNLLSIEKRFLSFNNIESLTKEILIDKILKKAEEKYRSKEIDFGEERFREVERVVLLQVVDSKWMDHIDAMDQLRQGIGLRAYGQEDPVRAYQNEGFDMFNEMTHSIWEDTVRFLYQVVNPEKIQRKRVAEPIATNADEVSKTIVNKEKKIGRNDPCPCGSGKKYKKCCGQDN
ncbi:preprotein translocase subunit SecA [Tissierella praeacuta DSM 18095]|uniref:Protein translocase subunit SecA n=1 Tax=Tissierella praeacuta DSM 18095 TaxID=1123404 RepID=A0A1M4XQ44_9FIRM|nr:preprotein translocase subunit SecA [Tissierella praeacuta]SHE95714.1 preprotein translocase subunit SecA [Tissierella praeacuta DSM 18095]SUO99761.1 preprotein translocase subunit SecA [Tissierella praeacuta]